MTRRVAVLGGGVAGLTAAHELALRGFEVDLYEKRTGPLALGGKARSQEVRTPSGQVLLGEHGYRFFPAFYEGVPDSMRRTPLDAASTPVPDDPAATVPGNVFESLRPAEWMAIARAGRPMAVIERDLPEITDLGSLVRAFVTIFHDIPAWDLVPIGAKLIHYATRGPAERLRVFEKQSFWDYMEASRFGEATRTVLEYTPKSLVAMKATEGNARTLLDLFLLMMIEFTRERPSDFVLPGPTSRAWIDPWVAWLRKLGVRFHLGVAIDRLELDGCSVRAVHAFRDGAPMEPIEADAFVLALPVEAASPIAERSLRAGGQCGELEKVRDFPLETGLGWMVGAQLFLRTPRDLVEGHIAFGDSAWAVSAISQRQFWSAEHRADLDRAGVGALWSVIATEWQASRFGRPRGVDCDRSAVERELCEQLAECRDPSGRPLLDLARLDEELVHLHLDEELSFDPVSGRPSANGARLLVHPPGLWEKRPDPWSDELDNLYFAGDWVRSPIDLATMEGANVAARMAVNKLLSRAGVAPSACCDVVADYRRKNEPGFLVAIQDLNDLRGGSEPPPAPASAPATTNDAEAELQSLAPRIARKP